MTDEEKLKQFYEITIDDAKKQNIKELQSYEDALRLAFADHREDAERRAELEVKLQKEILIKRKNSETARHQAELRRELGQKQDELKAKLFERILDKLIQFKKSDSYTDYMNKCINKALVFAKGVEMTIYVDSSDENMIAELKEKNNVEIAVSEEDIIGGVRAAIPAKNVLIDESFSSKLKEEQHKFKF